MPGQEENCQDCQFCRYNQIFVLGYHDNLTSTSTSTSTSASFTSANEMPISLPTINPDSSTLKAYHNILRTLTIAGWIPSFGLCLAHGIVSETPFPAVGIIATTLSSFVGALVLRNALKPGHFLFLTDIFLTVLTFVLLVPSWYLNSDGCDWQTCREPGWAMLAAYGTVPMMLNFGIHAYFVVYYLATDFSFKRQCPHCRGDLSQGTQRSMVERGGGRKETYQAISTNEDENEAEDAVPRPSTDDETARLV